MAFAYGYFNVAQPELEGDSNLACLTYENVISREDLWTCKENVCVLGTSFKLSNEREKFINFVRSKLWCTYRRGFNAIGGTGPTSDSGWGCMLRCGQMMLAQALSVLTLNKDWDWNKCEKQPTAYKKILQQLSDDRSSCYSIHQIAQMGVQEGKEVGHWFGPNTIAQVLRRLSQFDKENVLAFHVAMDNTVCIEDIEKLCSYSETREACEAACSYSGNGDTSPQCFSSKTTKSNASPSKACSDNQPNMFNGKSEAFWKPLFLIIPLRLGLSEINSIYFSHLKDVFKWEESVGVIGGKPNHAYYFIGCSKDSLVFLDPHTTQPYIKFPDVQSEENLEDNTYHCDCPSKMPLVHLDPSLALGFICTTKKEFERLCQRIKNFKKTPTSLPLFEVVERFPQCKLESRVLTVKSHSRQKRKEMKQGQELADDNACLALDSDESLESDEEFEILDFQ